MNLSDEALRHLRRVVDEPSLEGTPYELVGLLGRGGMGSVWEVRDERLDRTFALKVLDEPRVASAAGETLSIARIPDEARPIPPIRSGPRGARMWVSCPRPLRSELVAVTRAVARNWESGGILAVGGKSAKTKATSIPITTTIHPNSHAAAIRFNN